MRRAGFLVAAALMLVATGCGPQAEAGPTEDGGLTLELSFEEPLKSGTALAWELTVVNDGPAVTLEFSSGQSGDVVLSREGDEVYRWSEDRFFTMALRSEPLGPGERLSWVLEEEALEVEPGDYELTASLVSEPAPPDVNRPVTVEG